MSEQNPIPAYTDSNGNGGDSSVQADPALHVRLRAATKDFNNRELAELTGVSLETARRYAEGRGPGISFVKKLCEALGLSADWLLLGRGSPVYRPNVPLGQMDSSVDEVLDGLSRYLKRLHIELARAGTGLLPGGVSAPPAPAAASPGGAGVSSASVAPVSPGAGAGPGTESKERAETGGPEVPAEDFADPFGLAGLGLEGAAPPASPAAAPSASRAILVRLVLGPANGKQLLVPTENTGEIGVRLEGTGEARLVPRGGPAEPEYHVYRRVFDRVYRWVGSSRSP